MEEDVLNLTLSFSEGPHSPNRALRQAAAYFQADEQVRKSPQTVGMHAFQRPPSPSSPGRRQSRWGPRMARLMEGAPHAGRGPLEREHIQRALLQHHASQRSTMPLPRRMTVPRSGTPETLDSAPAPPRRRPASAVAVPRTTPEPSAPVMHRIPRRLVAVDVDDGQVYCLRDAQRELQRLLRAAPERRDDVVARVQARGFGYLLGAAPIPAEPGEEPEAALRTILAELGAR